MNITKICSKCKTEKDILLFHKGRPECKVCGKKYRENNKDKIKIYHQNWYNKNKEVIAEKSKVYRTNNPKVERKYRETHKKERKESHRLWREKNREKTNKDCRERYHENKHQIAIQRKEHIGRKRSYEKNRYRNDPLYKIARLLRNRFRDTIKNEYKQSSVIDLLGCSIQEFRQYIESLWTENMTWKNYGFSKLGEERRWHIDHILPLISFELTNIEEQKRCWNYANLRPLWQDENMTKSDKLPNGQRARLKTNTQGSS